MRASFIRRGLAALAAGLTGLGLVQAQAALAGALTVLPVRVEVAANRQFCSVTLGNDGPREVTVQVRGYRWHQEQGIDALDESEPLAVNPAIATIPPGARKLVRCSLPEQAGSTESTYRLIVSELPQAGAEPGTLQTLLQLSIPVFRTPPGARPSLLWAPTADGRLLVSNTGTRHVRLAGLVVRPAASGPVRAGAGFYLLAGARRVVDTGLGPSGIAAVEAMTEDGTFLPVLPDPAPQP